MVTKIYDPLYYCYISEGGFKEDVLWDADGDYCREAAAYAELQNSLATLEVTPAWYGTYTIDIETPTEASGQIKTYTRKVPLILLEHIHGLTMADIYPRALPINIRSAILKKVIDAECVIAHAGVRHGDYFPRNIILSGIDLKDPNVTSEGIEIHLKVKVIDFNVAEVLTHSIYKYRRGHLQLKTRDQLPSPVVRCYGQMENFYGWVSLQDADHWLWRQFHDNGRTDPSFGIPVILIPNRSTQMSSRTTIPARTLASAWKLIRLQRRARMVMVAHPFNLTWHLAGQAA
jgi:serine/threonine protein kinase